MHLSIDKSYSPFEELMFYYNIDFMVYYILVLIVFINCIKSIVNFMQVKKGKESKIHSNNVDLIISILCGIGLAYGNIFQGVLSDISQNYSHIWGPKLVVLSLMALILFIVQFVFALKIKGIKNKE